MRVLVQNGLHEVQQCFWFSLFSSRLYSVMLPLEVELISLFLCSLASRPQLMIFSSQALLPVAVGLPSLAYILKVGPSTDTRASRRWCMNISISKEAVVLMLQEGIH